jgi:hypothetical protein
MDNVDEERATLLKAVSAKVSTYHDRTPVLRRLPLASVLIILLLIGINIFVWVACGVVLV